VHKLIVAAERKSNALKISKDIAQAEQMMRGMLPRRSFVLAEAYKEAMAQGPAWRAGIEQGVAMLGEAVEALASNSGKVATTRRRGPKPATA
jgi:hypothetical protein